MGLWRGRKSIQRQLLNLRTPANGDNPATLVEPPAGSIAHKYWELATGKRVLNYTRSAGSKPGKKVAAYIHPFSINPPASTPPPTLVKFSNRAKGVISTHIGDAGDLHHVTTPEADPITRRGFRAAVITVFNPTGAESSEPSKASGVTYKKREGSSYSFPFGTNPAGALAYDEVRADLLGKALVKNADASVSFKPEVLK